MQPLVTVDTPTREAAEKVYAGFRLVMERAAADESLSRRLALADTTLEVELTDVPGEPMVISILFDRTPIEVVDGPIGDPEVRILARTRDIDRFWRGELQLAMAIAKGEIAYEGPVRKVLRVVPIARRLSEQYIEAVGEAQ